MLLAGRELDQCIDSTSGRDLRRCDFYLFRGLAHATSKVEKSFMESFETQGYNLDTRVGAFNV
jgi:hypothetical protein